MPAPVILRQPSVAVTQRIWQSYSRCMEAHPLKTKLAIASGVFSSGDYAAQKYEAKEEDIDYKRVLRQTVFGVGITCWLHLWWGILERKAEKIISAKVTRAGNTAIKVATDQTFGAGVFNAAYFFSLPIMEGGNVMDGKKRLEDCWWPQMQRHWCFWPWFHSFNFYCLSLHHRVVVQNVALVGWTGLMSVVTNQYRSILETSVDDGGTCITKMAPGSTETPTTN